MNDVIPPYRFAPDEVAWAKWAQAKLVELQRSLDLLRQSTGNQSTTQSGTIRVLGEALVDLDARVQAAINTITLDMGQVTTGTLDQSRVTGTWTKDVATAGSVLASGIGTFGTGLTSVGAAALDLSTIAGTRQPVWQHIATGRYGYAPSTLEAKTDIEPGLPFTAEDVYETIPVVWKYLGQVDIRDNPENPEYDPDYVVPMEIGLVAQWLVERNMSLFVVFHEDGVTPKTIDYSLFGAVANLVAVKDLNQRMLRLEGAPLRKSDAQVDFNAKVEASISLEAERQ